MRSGSGQANGHRNLILGNDRVKMLRLVVLRRSLWSQADRHDRMVYGQQALSLGPTFPKLLPTVADNDIGPVRGMSARNYYTRLTR